MHLNEKCVRFQRASDVLNALPTLLYHGQQFSDGAQMWCTPPIDVVLTIRLTDTTNPNGGVNVAGTSYNFRDTNSHSINVNAGQLCKFGCHTGRIDISWAAR